MHTEFNCEFTFNITQSTFYLNVTSHGPIFPVGHTQRAQFSINKTGQASNAETPIVNRFHVTPTETSNRYHKKRLWSKHHLVNRNGIC